MTVIIEHECIGKPTRKNSKGCLLCDKHVAAELKAKERKKRFGEQKRIIDIKAKTKIEFKYDDRNTTTKMVKKQQRLINKSLFEFK